MFPIVEQSTSIFHNCSIFRHESKEYVIERGAPGGTSITTHHGGHSRLSHGRGFSSVENQHHEVGLAHCSLVKIEDEGESCENGIGY